MYKRNSTVLCYMSSTMNDLHRDKTRGVACELWMRLYVWNAAGVAQWSEFVTNSSKNHFETFISKFWKFVGMKKDYGNN